MIKKIQSIILLSFVAAQAGPKLPESGHSFLFTRPLFSTVNSHGVLSPRTWLTTSKKFAVQVETEYQQSFNSQKLGNYFLMPHRDQLMIRGDANTTTAPLTDVRAEWLGLPADFQGTFSLKPTQSQFCALISARNTFGRLFDTDLLDNMWGFIEVPIIRVSNNLHFTQSDLQNVGLATAPVRDVISAFQNSTWDFQKIKTEHDVKTTVGELRIGFGKTFISNERAHLASYSAFSIPTNKAQNNKYLFEAQPGFNGQFAMIFGVNIQVPLSRTNETNTTSFFLNCESTNLIRNHQYRTLSLINKPWSQFLQFRTKGQVTNVKIPGVNVLTQKVRASLYNLMDLTTGIRFQIREAQGEIGVGFWGHQKERLKLLEEWQEIYGIAGTTTNVTSSASTITTLAANDVTFTPVTALDLDMHSGAAVATLVYRAHVSIGTIIENDGMSGFFGGGMFVEIPSNKTTAFSQWGVWAKLGASF